MAKAKTGWIRDHAIAFNETVTSAGNNFDANTLIMQNGDKTVSQLLTKFDERFGIEGQVGKWQALTLCLSTQQRQRKAADSLID